MAIGFVIYTDKYSKISYAASVRIQAPCQEYTQARVPTTRQEKQIIPSNLQDGIRTSNHGTLPKPQGEVALDIYHDQN